MSTCPSTDRLLRLLDDGLPEDEHTELVAHLETCDRLPRRPRPAGGPKRPVGRPPAAPRRPALPPHTRRGEGSPGNAARR